MDRDRRTGKRKGNPYPLLPPDVGEEEIEISDEDFEFLKENRDYAGFLKKLDTKSITRHVVRLADGEKDDALELLYEKRRKVAIEPAEEDGRRVARVDALPIKTLDGKLCYRTAVEENVGSQSLGKDPDPKTSGGIVESETMKKKSTKAERRKKLKERKKQEKAESKEEKKRSVSQEKSTSEVLESIKQELSAEEIFEKKKTKLAEVGTSLLVDPEKNISSLKELLGMCNDDNKTIVKLGLLSLLAVFKDIIPGYRIRLPTEKELQMVVSKEVKRMRYYESMLLNSYRAYLQKLITLEKESFFHHVAIHCLCCLLEAVPHFNLRESLLDVVVRNTNSDEVTRKLCCDAVKSIFLNEGKHGGEATVEAVELVSDLVKSHDCQLHPDCIEVFLSLSFDNDLAKPEPVKVEEKTNKKRRRAKHGKADEGQVDERKQMKQKLFAKAQDEVNADFRTVSFIPDQSERRKIQTHTLSAVFGTYFRILKHIMGNAVSGSLPGIRSSHGAFAAQSLLLPCLRGLGNFSHLISVDFLGDLLDCLKKLATGRGSVSTVHSESYLTAAERLQCCVVAFRIMRNNMDALNVDLQEFFVQLYNLILEYSPDRENLGGLFAEALKVMLCEDRQHDMHRAAAFIKRLATFCLSFGSAEAMTAMVTLRHLLQKNSKCQSLLENDGGGGSLAGPIAKYHPDASDPNLSGALTSVLWELSLLGRHYHPAVSAMASSISNMNVKNSQIYFSTLTPQQAFTDYSIDQEKFIALPNLPKTIRNQKRSKSSTFLSTLTSNEEVVEDDELMKGFSDHFQVVRDITENKKLRRELDLTLSSLHLYKKFRKQRKNEL